MRILTNKKKQSKIITSDPLVPWTTITKNYFACPRHFRLVQNIIFQKKQINKGRINNV